MKDLDFLPEWYKEDRRRHAHVRRQYLALVAIFLVMMAFNATSIHRANRAAANLAQLEGRRAGAEAVVHEFNGLTKRVNALKTRVNLVEEIDPRVDPAALLAELSHVIGETIVLRKLQIVAEPFRPADERTRSRGAAVRLGGRTEPSNQDTLLGAVKFQIVLTGIAASPADVPDLVCRLDASRYFQRVHLSFYGSAKARAGGPPASVPREGSTPTAGAWDVTEFEIVCYLANYEETQE
jgi:Tfp pilus assembly protein PilN